MLNVLIHSSSIVYSICWYILEAIHTWGSAYLGQCILEAVHTWGSAYLRQCILEAIHPYASSCYHTNVILYMLDYLEVLNTLVFISAIVSVGLQWLYIGLWPVKHTISETTALCTSFTKPFFFHLTCTMLVLTTIIIITTKTRHYCWV